MVDNGDCVWLLSPPFHTCDDIELRVSSAQVAFPLIVQLLYHSLSPEQRSLTPPFGLFLALCITPSQRPAFYSTTLSQRSLHSGARSLHARMHNLQFHRSRCRIIRLEIHQVLGMRYGWIRVLLVPARFENWRFVWIQSGRKVVFGHRWVLIDIPKRELSVLIPLFFPLYSFLFL